MRHAARTAMIRSNRTGEKDEMVTKQQAPVEIGQIFTGRCVTTYETYTGTVSEIRDPSFPGPPGYLCKLTGTGQAYAGGAPIEPICYC